MKIPKAIRDTAPGDADDEHILLALSAALRTIGQRRGYAIQPKWSWLSRAGQRDVTETVHNSLRQK